MEYLVHLAILASIYGIVVLGLNLITGYTGLISLAHAAFFGVGAYATAILSDRLAGTFFVSLILGVIIAVILAYVTSVVVRALSGDYYVLGTLAVNFLVYSVMLNWISLTNGPFGITGIARPSIFGFEFNDSLSFFIFVFLVLCLVYFLSDFIAKSSLGRVLKIIREDEQAAQVFGYDTLKYKTFVFCVGAGFAALAGSFYAVYIRYIDPSTFTAMESAFMISIVVLGGLGSLKGTVVGTIILVVIPEFLRFVGFGSDTSQYVRLGLYGVILVVLMLYRPKGLFGEYIFK